jgi:hypothetical protein
MILGNRFIARAKPAWHNIARRIFGATEVISASDAMREVAGDISFEQSPLFYEMDGVRHETDNIALIRKPTADDPKPSMMGIATGSWMPPDYVKLARSLDMLPKNGYLVETAGVLQDGGLAFLCFRGEDWAVKGDEMRSYFAANFSGVPGIGHRLFHSGVRVVCWNTNTQAQGQATINLSIPHSQDVQQRIDMAARLVTQFREMKETAKGIFTAFADRQVTQKDVDAIIYAAFQLPKLPPKLALLKQQLTDTEAEVFKKALTPSMLIDLQKEQEKYERANETISAMRATAQERFEAFEPANLRGTAWAAYNAVTEVADWREGRNADEGALFGARAQEKSRAYAAAMALDS